MALSFPRIACFGCESLDESLTNQVPSSKENGLIAQGGGNDHQVVVGSEHEVMAPE